MELEAVRDYLLNKKGSAEEQPFGPDDHVYKVGGKMFGLLSWKATPLKINLKCNPELAIVLRERYPAVQAGYHMSKRHWNTVTLDGSIPDEEVYAMIDDSYDLVLEGLPKKVQAQLLNGEG